MLSFTKGPIHTEHENWIYDQGGESGSRKLRNKLKNLDVSQTSSEVWLLEFLWELLYSFSEDWLKWSQ